MQNTLLYRNTREAALRLLAIREHSIEELHQKLEKHCCDEAVRQAVIDWLSRENLQSNDRFSECYIRSRLAKGYGPKKIRWELLQKGIAPEEIDHHMLDITIDWLPLLKKQFDKKFSEQDFENALIRAKIYRYFQSRGFSMEQIKVLEKSLA